MFKINKSYKAYRSLNILNGRNFETVQASIPSNDLDRDLI